MLRTRTSAATDSRYSNFFTAPCLLRCARFNG
jgi:hypothetical protein